MSNLGQPLLDEVAQLEVHAQHQLNGLIRSLRVVVQDDGIVLRGQAHTYYVKQLAQQIVMKRMGLPIYANEIEVL
jgi:hypothetical protein